MSEIEIKAVFTVKEMPPNHRGIAQNQDKGLSQDMLVILAEFSFKSFA